MFDAQVGFLICTELWYFEQARLYGLEGVHLLVTPRLTGGSTLDKWLVGGRAAAIAAGAFGLSSNRFHKSGAYGGQGWVVGPDGEVLALTSADEPFVSVRIDLEAAKKAKSTYPRYAISDPSPRDAALMAAAGTIALAGQGSSTPLPDLRACARKRRSFHRARCAQL